MPSCRHAVLSRRCARECAPQAERTRRRPARARVASSEIEGARRPRSVTRRPRSSEIEVVVVVVVRVSAESPPLSGDARRTPQTRRGALARPAKRRRGRVGGARVAPRAPHAGGGRPWVVDGHDSLARPPPLATADLRRPRDNGRRMGFVCTESHGVTRCRHQVSPGRQSSSRRDCPHILARSRHSTSSSDKSHSITAVQPVA